MFECKYCKKEFSKRAIKNHEIRCPSNPNREYKNGMLGKKGGNQYTKAKELGLEKPKYDTKCWNFSGACKWSKPQRSAAAKAQGFGGYRENAGRSKKFKVLDSFGKEVTLQSTYELRCSEILNLLSIKWIRPKALKYDARNYFADFYLPEYDIWLDPKNKYKAALDMEKINKVIEQNNIKLFVLLEEQLNVDYIKRLCS